MSAALSQPYRGLKSMIARLETAFGSFQSSASTSDEHVLVALGFRVLAHAAVESYLEEVTLEKALAAATTWKARRRVSRVLAALLLFQDSLEDAGQAPAPKKKPVDLQGKIDWALARFSDRVKENHGIREANLLGLLAPIGCLQADIKPSLVATLDSFGQERGEAAHKAFGSITSVPLLTEEIKRANVAVGLLKELDRLLARLS